MGLDAMILVFLNVELQSSMFTLLFHSMRRLFNLSLLSAIRAVSSVYLLLLLLSRFSRVRLFATPWTVANQAPLSMGFWVVVNCLSWAFCCYSRYHCYHIFLTHTSSSTEMTPSLNSPQSYPYSGYYQKINMHGSWTHNTATIFLLPQDQSFFCL